MDGNIVTSATFVPGLRARRSITPWGMGISIAATYTWAASVLVGMAMLKEAGIIPFILWFLANTSAVPLFGYVTLRWPGLWNASRRLPFRVIMTGVLFFILWFNMSGIVWMNGELGRLSLGWAQVIAIVTALSLWLMIAKGGIRWSILTDIPQWFLLAGGVTAALLITLAQSGFQIDTSLRWHSYDTLKGTLLGIWSVPLLLTALFMDGMFWQRARYIRGMRPYWIGYGLFTGYLVLVAVLSFLSITSITPLAMTVLFVLVYFASQSTMDSALSGLHLSMGKRLGIAGGLVAIALWIPMAGLGILDAWLLFFGWFPLFFIALVAAYLLERKGMLKPVSQIVLDAQDAIPELPVAGASLKGR